MGSIREAADAQRQAAEAASARELDAASFTELVLGLAAWVEEGRERRRFVGDKHLEEPRSRVAPELMDRMARKAHRRGRGMRLKWSASDLHPLRKTLKKLRYSVEFLSSLYPRKAVKRFLKPVKGLQESLGAVNAAVGGRLAERLAQEGRLDLAAAVGALTREWEGGAREARRRLDTQWRAFQDADRFWR